MTQLTLKPGPVFICGPLQKNIFETERDFSEKEEVLNSFGLNTVNQFFLFKPSGLNIGNLKYTIMHLIGCNTLITLNNWENCEFAKKQVEIARIMGIDVISYSKLILHLTEKNS